MTTIFSNLREALSVLKESDLFIGDIRDPNVLVNGAGELKRIDFDWAGKAGQVNYHCNVNVTELPHAKPLGSIN